jgi:hypothetical protein
MQSMLDCGLGEVTTSRRKGDVAYSQPPCETTEDSVRLMNTPRLQHIQRRVQCDAAVRLVVTVSPKAGLTSAVDGQCPENPLACQAGVGIYTSAPPAPNLFFSSLCLLA